MHFFSSHSEIFLYVRLYSKALSFAKCYIVKRKKKEKKEGKGRGGEVRERKKKRKEKKTNFVQDLEQR